MAVNQSQPKSQVRPTSRHRQLAASTYKNNCASDYTEVMQKLDSDFDYEDNKHLFWGPEELSLFYGTDFYRECSESQRLALNHLYWVTQYNQTAATEANAILYNQVTEGVFSAVGGYEVLCKELDLETDQEHHHIHAFHSVGFKTNRAMFGHGLTSKPKVTARRRVGAPSSRPPADRFSVSLPQLDWQKLTEHAYRFVNKTLSSGSGSKSYSRYLLNLEAQGKPLPIQKSGLLGQVIPANLSKFLTIGFGTSPFSACFFYATRYQANMILKNYEHRYLQYYKQLEKSSSPIATPTAISYYHMLDESFHTTTSQLISQDLYKEFTTPTAYEILMSNVIFYRGQQVLLSGLSGVMPATFRHDGMFLTPLYRILRSPLFDMEHDLALSTLESCVCKEHEGFHMNTKHHQRLYSTMQQAFEPMDYLWKVNKNLEVMQSGLSISNGLNANKKAFATFKSSFME